MFSGFQLFPERASTAAGGVDALYFFLVAVAAFFSLLIFAMVFYFALRYRRRSEDERPQRIAGSLKLEIAWSVIPLGITMVMFGWGAWLYFQNARPPAEAMEIYVVGKQWMWKVQHPEGVREINELHVPVGVPVRLVLTSEDVIHSFYVPVFRIKQDALPGRYTSEWFQATKPGRYHLFCAEYCGTDHSQMKGWVTVMTEGDYQKWLDERTQSEPMAVAGRRLFDQFACSSCHRDDAAERGPSLNGLFNRQVVLEGGQRVTADEGYLRESILNPRARTVLGYKQIMPTYQGQLSEEQILKLIAYIKSLQNRERTTTQ